MIVVDLGCGRCTLVRISAVSTLNAPDHGRVVLR
eukprot:COSAG02_NODE_47860_length_338_cov_0.652720_2_plen_33_part_01